MTTLCHGVTAGHLLDDAESRSQEGAKRVCSEMVVCSVSDCPQKHLKEVERVVPSKDKEIKGLLFLLKLL